MLVISLLVLQFSVFADTSGTSEEIIDLNSNLVQPMAVAQQVLDKEYYVYRDDDIIQMPLHHVTKVYKNLYPPTGYHYVPASPAYSMSYGSAVFKGEYWERIDTCQYYYVLVSD